MILVDTNVLLDLVTDDPNWSEWSLARLEEVALDGPVLINDVVYAETSIRYERLYQSRSPCAPVSRIGRCPQNWWGPDGVSAEPPSLWHQSACKPGSVGRAA